MQREVHKHKINSKIEMHVNAYIKFDKTIYVWQTAFPNYMVTTTA